MKTYEIVDTIQDYKEQIKALEDKLAPFILTLKNRGVDVYEGSIADAQISEISQDKTDWKSIVSEYNIPTRVIKKHTKNTKTLRCTIVNKTIQQKVA